MDKKTQKFFAILLQLGYDVRDINQVGIFPTFMESSDKSPAGTKKLKKIGMLVCTKSGHQQGDLRHYPELSGHPIG